MTDDLSTILESCRIPYKLLPEHEARRRLIFSHKKFFGNCDENVLKGFFGTSKYNDSFGLPIEQETIPRGVRNHLKEIMTVYTSYTCAELADLLGVTFQAIGQWKRLGYFPQEALAPNNRFYKVAIDPILDDLIARSKNTKKKSRRTKSTTTKIPLQENTHTIDKSVTFEPVAESTTTEIQLKESTTENPLFIEFQRGLSAIEITHAFWKHEDRAVNALTLPPDVIPIVVEHVKAAIRFCLLYPKK